MAQYSLITAALIAGTFLSGCEAVIPYTRSPDTVIARAHDTDGDKIGLTEGGGGIAYDPDGCQGWIIDDGVESYAGRRYDPISGLPVCNSAYPPGTVLRDYQTASPGLPDFVPN